jgi:tRNA threonylcarbamoyladenosine biosynthesis protein TsaE
LQLPDLLQTPFRSFCEGDTFLWSQHLASCLKPGDCVLLQGNVGAGKTRVVQALCKALGYDGEVHSPTYSLVHEYPFSLPLFHVDLYRLPECADLEEIGIDYYRFTSGYTFIEWPERLGTWNVQAKWMVQIEIASQTERVLQVEEL